MLSFFYNEQKFRLEHISPDEEYVDPVAAYAWPAIGGIDTLRTGLTNPKIFCRLIGAIAQVRSIIPKDVDPGAHARCDEIPQIPLTQQDSGTMELGNMPADSRSGARNSGRTVTIHRHVIALKVRAD